MEKTQNKIPPKYVYIKESGKVFIKLNFDENDNKVKSFLKIIERRKSTYDKLSD
jgi:hypothetical protein